MPLEEKGNLLFYDGVLVGYKYVPEPPKAEIPIGKGRFVTLTYPHDGFSIEDADKISAAICVKYASICVNEVIL